MLKGKSLGGAIDKAIKLKLALTTENRPKSKAAIARHFGMKPPSLVDWVKKGSISKDKLPELFKYFSDVVGHEHWGLTPSEWPAGLSESKRKPPAVTRVQEPTGDDYVDAIRAQEALALDAYKLIEAAFAALVIVGSDKDALIKSIEAKSLKSRAEVHKTLLRVLGKVAKK